MSNNKVNESINNVNETNNDNVTIDMNEDTNESGLCKEVTLTTFDNPFNPFEDFRKWFLYDVEKGYNTCKILGRITDYSDNFTQKEKDEAIEAAIDEFIKHDALNIYRKVTRIVKETDYISS